MARFFRHRLASPLTARRVVVTLAGVGTVYLVSPPLVLTVLSAFRAPADALPFDSGTSWSLSNFISLYTTGEILSTVLDTALFAAGSVALATFLALALAYLIGRTDLPLRVPLLALLLLPVLMPTVVTTIAWVLVLGERTGALNLAIRAVVPLWNSGPIDVFSMTGMIIVQGFSLVPLLVVFFIAALRGIDRSLEEAAEAAGVSKARVVTGITLPLIRPHLLAGIILAFIFAIEAFEVPLLLALGSDADILATRVYFALNDATGGAPRYGTVGVLGVHFLAITYVLFFAYQRLARGEGRFAMNKRIPYKLDSLGKWRWPCFIAIGAFVLLVSVVPLVVLLWTSLHPQYIAPSISALAAVSLDQYASLLSDNRLLGALVNTILVAVLAPALGVGTALLLAVTTERRLASRLLSSSLSTLASSTIAIPSVIAANALLVFYLSVNRVIPSWIPLFGTVWLLVLAYAYRISVAYQLQRAGVAQIDAELEEAAHVSGAGPWRTLTAITAPLLRANWIGAWILLGVFAFRELSLPLVINRGGPPHLVSTLVWELWGSRTGEAAALGFLSTLVALGGLSAGWWVLMVRKKG